MSAEMGFWEGEKLSMPLDSPSSSEFSQASSHLSAAGTMGTMAQTSDQASSPVPPSAPPESTVGSDVLGDIDQQPPSHLALFPTERPSMDIPSQPFAPNTQASVYTVAESLPVTPRLPQMQVNRGPCPDLTFLEQYGVTLNAENTQLMETLWHLGIFLPHYNAWIAQQMPHTTLTAPPSMLSSFGESTVTDLPDYGCPGLKKPRVEPTEGPFQCPMCGRRSKRKNDIMKHMMGRNPPISYRCHHPSCQHHDLFTRKDKYTAHLRKYHRDAPRDERSINMDGVPSPQHYPERCLHCPEPMRSWKHWYSHWFTAHNDPSGRYVRPIGVPWPASALHPQTQAPRPNLGVAGMAGGSGFVYPSLHHWEMQHDALQGLMATGENFPRQGVVQSVMQNVGQCFENE